MASYVFNIAKKMLLDATLDLDADTIKLTLVMTNSTILTATTDNSGTEAQDLDTVSAVTTLDEMDGSGFTWGHGGTGRKTLANISVTVDDTDDEGVFDNTVDLTWSSLGAGARDVAGALLHRAGTTDDSDAIPIAFIDFTDTPANGGDFTVQFATEGILNLN